MSKPSITDPDRTFPHGVSWPSGPRARSLNGGGFASAEQRLEQAAIGESYDVARPPKMRSSASGRKRLRALRSRPRGSTLATKAITRGLLASQAALLGTALLEHGSVARPRTRGQCASEERPCPWVACRHHLYLDVNPETGSIKINFPDLEPWELAETCALDVADRGGVTLEDTGRVLNLTRERIRQMEISGLRALRRMGGIDP